MAFEKTLTVVKPHNERMHVEIFAFLDGNLTRTGEFTRSSPLKIRGVNEGLIRSHYSHIMHIPTYEDTIQAFRNGTVFASVYSGDGIVQRVRDVLGATNCAKAAQGTLRKTFWDETTQVSWDEAQKRGLYYNNFMHASGSAEEAQREIESWLNYHPNLLQS
ncbi:hypothetical protein HYT24_02425 [Candidatus Pacearchaeota archaeon]|nr:hypothetical protein [Candidatus Pacearchaeota archaeon]